MSEESKPWTAGRLRQVLAGVPDDTVIVVNTDDPHYPNEFVEQHTIHDAGYGQVDWGDGYGLERSQSFGLICHVADGIEERPDRPPKAQPQAEQEAEVG
jgi:hypothetical protein